MRSVSLSADAPPPATPPSRLRVSPCIVPRPSLPPERGRRVCLAPAGMVFAAGGCLGSTGLGGTGVAVRDADAGVPDAHAQSCTSCRHSERCPTLSNAVHTPCDRAACLRACWLAAAGGSGSSCRWLSYEAPTPFARPFAALARRKPQLRSPAHAAAEVRTCVKHAFADLPRKACGLQRVNLLFLMVRH